MNNSIHDCINDFLHAIRDQELFIDTLATHTNKIIAINAIVLMIILTAGLWPLQFAPRNPVSFLKNRNGIVFTNNGLVFEQKKGSLPGTVSFLNRSPGLGIEIFLKPYSNSAISLSTILGIYDDSEPDLFMLARWYNHLIMRRRLQSPDGKYRYHEVDVNNTFTPGTAYHIMVSMDERGTVIDINGRRKSFPEYRLQRDGKTSDYRIILGNDPRIKNPWIGEINGLAIYDRSLHAGGAAVNPFLRGAGDLSRGKGRDGIVAWYPMDERSGSVIHNAVSSGNNLVLPGHLYAIKKSYLALPWPGFSHDPVFYADLLLNVAGFVPVGFFLSLLFISFRKGTMFPRFILPVLMGSGISLSIELVQAFMPARSSSITDLLCNMLGTILGVAILPAARRAVLIITKKPDGSGLSI